MFFMAETDDAAMNSARGSELMQPIWAVVSFDRVEADNVTYVEAEAKMKELAAAKVAGLCIIASAAAARLRHTD